MTRFGFMCSVALSVAAIPVFASAQTPPPTTPPQDSASSVDDIIVTATRRSQALSDVPQAISAVTAESLQNSGGSDLRALNQVSPSLFVSSSTSEAGASGVRVRGMGTLGDNPGLESSVATFIDGVYRNRSGVGLTELGAIDRVEVLRGPQGTLFGRNASAGLISVITSSPSFTPGADVEATLGNYGAQRLSVGVTGALAEKVAGRLDGVYFKRDGFFEDRTSGRDLNDRDRYLLRGQLLILPNDDLTVRLIADVSSRDEECCAASYLPFETITAGAAPGSTVATPGNSIASLLRAMGADIRDDPYARETSLTPGVSYLSEVRDGGVSAEVNYERGGVTATSITAYRDWSLTRGQDADFTNLDILRRNDDGGASQGFETFSQELRLQGTAFDDRLDWLVGGYYAHEILSVTDNLQYGQDYERYANCLLISSVLPSALAPTSSAGGSCINVPVVQATIAGLSALPSGDPRRANIGPLSALIANPARPGIGSLAATIGQPGLVLNGTGLRDTYEQTSDNLAVFTHNVVRLTDRLNLTLGLRYTSESKTLDAALTDNNVLCRSLTVTPLAAFATLACVNPSVPGGTFSSTSEQKEDRVTGTGVLSFKPIDGSLLYASYSTGYKSGGFNLDRSALRRRSTGGVAGDVLPTASADDLRFDPELVKAYEIGYKLNARGFDLNLAAFYQTFDGFQLNVFNGLNFAIVNINACKASLNGGDKDASATTGACSDGLQSGITSKGLELEAFMRPATDVAVNLGLTYADTRFRDNLVVGTGAPLTPVLFQLPGARLPNSSKYVATGSFTWTPPLGGTGLTGLFYADARYQSAFNTGADRDLEKTQDGFVLVNARVGVRGPDDRWGVELWAQNLFDVEYQQVALDVPLQGSGTTAAVQRGFVGSSSQLYGAFLGEPRTFGLTARFKY